MPRADLSNDLIHWIKGDSNEEAFDVLRIVAREQRLLGGTGHIKGSYRCICFTEAPENTFHNVIGRYRPFGVRVSKRWLYGQGGRPVIYQADSEFTQLAETHRWRHVRYEPDEWPPIDFSWEREWRIQTDEIQLPHGEARLVLPHDSWAEALEREHLDDELHRIQMEAVAYGDEWLMQNPEPFYYAYSIINV